MSSHLSVNLCPSFYSWYSQIPNRCYTLLILTLTHCVVWVCPLHFHYIIVVSVGNLGNADLWNTQSAQSVSTQSEPSSGHPVWQHWGHTGECCVTARHTWTLSACITACSTHMDADSAWRALCQEALRIHRQALLWVWQEHELYLLKAPNFI